VPMTERCCASVGSTAQGSGSLSLDLGPGSYRAGYPPRKGDACAGSFQRKLRITLLAIRPF
jgi:hypothetical protein